MWILWILNYVLVAAVLVSFAWIGIFFLRQAHVREWRKGLMSASVYIWVGIYCYAVWQWPQPSDYMLAAAAALFGLSLLVFWGAVRAHGKTPPAFAFVKTAPASFVQWGPYRFVRHPLYTSYLIAYIAGAFLTTNLLVLISVPWLGAFYYYAARGEERAFSDTEYADEYRQYQAATGMLVPKLSALLCCRPSCGSSCCGQPQADERDGGDESPET